MSFYVLTSHDWYKSVCANGGAPVGRVSKIFGKSKTKNTERDLFSFEIAVKKYPETISDKCKEEYFTVKAWGNNANECAKLIRVGCTITFAGDFVESSIKLIQLLDVRYPEKTKEEKHEEEKHG